MLCSIEEFLLQYICLFWSSDKFICIPAVTEMSAPCVVTCDALLSYKQERIMLSL